MVRGSLLCLIFLGILLWTLSLCQAETDTLKQGQQLHDWEQLISSNGVFKLGFLSPSWESVDIGAFAPRYIGIWFTEIPFYPLWVANPNNLIPDTSGVLKMDTDGVLKIAYKGGSAIVVSSNQGKKPISETNITVTLLDSGNLVVREIGSDGKVGPILWQSFDYPPNMLLPEMKLGINHKTGHEWYLSSWLSDKLPSPGAFKLGLNPDGSGELMIWRRGEVYWRSGAWKNGSFELAPKLTSRVDAYEFRFVSNENESFFSYSTKSKSILSKWELESLGEITQFTLDRRGGKNEWIFETISSCNIDYAKNESAVCLNEKPVKCRNGSEFFVPKTGYMEMIFLSYWDDNASLGLSDCHAKCWQNCSCVAYKSLSQNGTGCLFWSRFRESKSFLPEVFEDLYVLNTLQSANSTEVIHMASGESAMKEPCSRITKKWWSSWLIWSIIAIEIVLSILFLSILCHLRVKNQQLSQKIGEMKQTKINKCLHK